MTIRSLSVHKNKIEARRKRELSEDLTRRVKALVKEEDLRAYAIVGISAEGKAFALWDTGAIIPMWAFADTIGNALRRNIEESGVSEDWKPALNVRGSTDQ